MASRGAGRPPAQEVTALETAGPLEDAWKIFDARHMPYRVLMLGKMLDRLSVQHVRDLGGISLAEWRVLAHLAVMGPKSASEVSAAALVDRAEVSRAVRMLEEGGYVVREDNPRNRKSNLLVLTDAGKTIYERVHKERRLFFDTLTADFGPDDLGLLDNLLLRMARQADRLLLDGFATTGKAP
ncbi:MarR family winged helix-turn-helix transcriptional regulator [Sphingobium nicotianae]|uniref:MarR family transcriptional regulator n=1 Tax=Sphingobium nicotianae TaxID=2782607 RepID=A0A9X1IRE8_9SPHN|nr:MarR family transcriptional regulator [Sphingobium nicotianae]MBT2187408.1 MarR family transcriptional regulator [Sphingobium nicotianae]